LSTPTAPALPQSLEIARSLRPLRRRVESRVAFTIDERATVQRSAEDRALRLIMQPMRARWLAVDLVIDTNDSMLIWRSTIADLKRLLMRLGAFRDVRLWQLDTQSPDPTMPPRLFAGIRPGGDGSGWGSRRLKELANPGGRRLVLIISDCVAPGWHSGAVAKEIERWGASTPVAIVQTLPEHLWGRTALGKETPVELRAMRPAAPNVMLEVRPQDRRPKSVFLNQRKRESSVAVPVIGLRPREFRAWARFVVSDSNAWMTGRLLRTKPRPVAADAALQSLSADERISRFFANASPEAQELALCLSATPVTLPVINLVQGAMRRHAFVRGDLAAYEPSPSYAAEVLNAGLLYQDTAAGPIESSDDIVFEFFDGVRERLFADLTVPRAQELIRQVSEYISQRVAQRAIRVGALLPDGTPGVVSLPESRPFAEINALLLRGLGFQAIADALERSAAPGSASAHQADSLKRGGGVEDASPVARDIERRRRAFAPHPLYAGVVPLPIEAEQLVVAEELLATLPLDDLPEPAPLPDASRLPAERNAHFVGREDALRTLARNACDNVPTVITGPAAIGKSQLALEFAYRYGRFFAGGVCWVGSGEPQFILSEIAACGQSMGLAPNFTSLPLERQVKLVLAAWQSALPRLLIFDGCIDDATLGAWEPLVGGARVLITSRRSETEWNKDLQLATLPINATPREESIALLRRYVPVGEADDEALDLIAAALADLPLALHLAGRLLADNVRDSESSIRTMVQRLTEPSPDAPLDFKAVKPHRLTKPQVDAYARVLNVSFPRWFLRTGSEAPRLLLYEIACLARGEPVPLDLLRSALRLGSEEELSDDRIAQASATLLASGYVEQYGNETVRLHAQLLPFIEVVTVSLTAGAADAVDQALLLYGEELRERGAIGDLLALLPHLYHRSEALAPTDPRRADLLNVMGTALYLAGDYTGADTYYRTGLEINERLAKASTNPKVQNAWAASLNAMGALLQAKGDYTSARDHYERALEIRTQVIGTHPDTAASLNNLAGVLALQGDYDGARKRYELARTMYTETIGAEEPVTAATIDNLAGVLTQLGEYHAARDLYTKALRIRERKLGSEHPATAATRNNMGRLCYELGQIKEARPLLEGALATRQQTLGSEHPDTATSMNNLALVIAAQGDLARARELLEQALAIREQALGREHPDSATCLHSLGDLCVAQGDDLSARTFYERALAIRQQVLGPEHLATALSLNALGALLARTGDVDSAESELYQALDIFERSVGPYHPSIAAALNNLGDLLKSRSPMDARRFYERALAIREHTLGPQHLDTLQSLNALGVVLHSQGEFEAARDYLTRAYDTARATLGRDHLTTRTIERNLASLPKSLVRTSASNVSSEIYFEWWQHAPRELGQYVQTKLPSALRMSEYINRLDLLADEGPRGVVKQLYEVLLKQGINYELSPFDLLSSSIQPIRTPQSILDQGRANCLDLVVLFAGMCLANDLLPIIVAVEGHVFLGVSLTNTRGTAEQVASTAAFDRGMLEDLAVLQEWAEDGDRYLFVECTGAARSHGALDPRFPEGRGRGSQGTMSFKRACQAGLDQLLKFTGAKDSEIRANQRRFLYALHIHDLQVKYSFPPIKDDEELNNQPGPQRTHQQNISGDARIGTAIAGDVHGSISSSNVTLGGDISQTIDARGSQGFITRPTGPVTQHFESNEVTSPSEERPKEAVGNDQAEQIQSLNERHRILTRRHRELKKQEAMFGALYTPPHIIIEIKDLEREIADLKRQITALEGGPTA
jgi:tetratricopeptide (TPR) repeat protein